MYVRVDLALMRFPAKVCDQAVTVLATVFIAHFHSEPSAFDEGIRRPQFALCHVLNWNY